MRCISDAPCNSPAVTTNLRGKSIGFTCLHALRNLSRQKNLIIEFQEIYTNLTLEHIDGWTELYDYTAMRQKSTRQPSGNEALVIGHGRMFDDIPVALAVSNFAYMGGSMGAVVGEKFRAIVHF